MSGGKYGRRKNNSRKGVVLGKASNYLRTGGEEEEDHLTESASRQKRPAYHKWIVKKGEGTRERPRGDDVHQQDRQAGKLRTAKERKRNGKAIKTLRSNATKRETPNMSWVLKKEDFLGEKTRC